MIIFVRVLIVEDDQNLAETVKTGLEESGYALTGFQTDSQDSIW
jgi:DNA-binding response OmpR family regulator